MFRICDQNSADYTLMFSLILLFLSPVKASVSHTAPPGWGWSKIERRQSQDTDPSDQRGAPHCMMLCSVVKAGGKEEGEGTLGLMVFVFPSQH